MNDSVRDTNLQHIMADVERLKKVCPNVGFLHEVRPVVRRLCVGI